MTPEHRRQRRRRHRQAGGFTLVEVLVALAILAVVAASLVSSATRNTDQARQIRDRQLALVVAQNELERLRLNLRTEADFPGTGSRQNRQRFGGFDFEVQTSVRDTENNNVRRVTVSVARPSESGDYELASLEGFVGRF